VNADDHIEIRMVFYIVKKIVFLAGILMIDVPIETDTSKDTKARDDAVIRGTGHGTEKLVIVFRSLQ
jgi:hypothetical protein